MGLAVAISPRGWLSWRCGAWIAAQLAGGIYFLLSGKER